MLFLRGARFQHSDIAADVGVPDVASCVDGNGVGARILAGQVALGMPSLKRALEILAERKQFQRLQNAGLRVVTELNERGLKTEAVDIEILLKMNLPATLTSETKETPTRKPILPTHCPNCGAALRPDEVEWLDDLTAECGYCGSPAR